ncbi:RNA polymerase sigma-70 factor [Ravibacter arvi]|uniref:RNA polymerase sigma-70 factor n=1 Tax=Ravibacter arvi TaxID=2051041 RepID=A0ABP8ME44_9BACT
MPFENRLHQVKDSDEQHIRLVRLLAVGNEEAFREIYDLFWDKLLKFVFSKINCRESAEEIVQEIFLDLWEKRETRQIRHLSGYLFRLARNKALDTIRAQIVRDQHREYFCRQNSNKDSGTEASLAFQDLSDAIQMSLAHMPEKTREIFRMNRFEFLTVREISSHLQLSERTVEYHIAYALRTLRLYLKDFLPSVILLLMT